MICIKFKSKSGLTLIELVVTLSIMSIFLASLLRFFLFNVNSFTKGEEMVDIQSNVRMASNYITSELRNVSNFSISEFENSKQINLSALKAKFHSVEDVSFDLIIENNRVLVKYKISAIYKDRSTRFEIESKVLLNNDLLFKNKLSEVNNITTIYYE